MNAIDEAAARADLGTPTAVKRGRNPRWPYVPVLVVGGGTSQPGGYTTQLRGRAFATAAEALAYATDHVDRARAKLAADLADPRHRALREHHGLPRDLDAPLV